MNKWTLLVVGLTTAAMLFGSTPATLADTPQGPGVQLNGKQMNFPDATPYVDEKDRTMVPVRFIAEGLGAKVDWFEMTKFVVINLKGKEIRLQIDKDIATVNGTNTQLDTKAVFRNSRTFVPLRFVSETLGADVKWDGTNNQVLISFKGAPSSDPGTIPTDPVPNPQPDLTKDMWGRATRTTNLPSNAADFPFILADQPNEMYELPLQDKGVTTYFKSPKELLESNPDGQLTKENFDIWANKVRTHYQLVFNVDYTKVDDNWVQSLYATKNMGGRDYSQIYGYVNWVKKNQIQAEGTVEPEPSILYSSSFGYMMRAKVKFRVLNFDKNYNVLYDDDHQDTTYQKGAWYTGFMDVALTGNIMGGNWGPSLAVSNVQSLWFNSNLDFKK